MPSRIGLWRAIAWAMCGVLVGGSREAWATGSDAVNGSSVVGAPASAPVLKTFARDGESRPWLISGLLVAASRRSPVEIAREAIAKHASWALSLGLEFER